MCVKHDIATTNCSGDDRVVAVAVFFAESSLALHLHLLWHHTWRTCVLGVCALSVAVALQSSSVAYIPCACALSVCSQRPILMLVAAHNHPTNPLPSFPVV